MNNKSRNLFSPLLLSVFFWCSVSIAGCDIYGGLSHNRDAGKVRLNLLEDSQTLNPALSAEVQVLHLSDLHIHRETLITRRALETIADLNPDIILMTGDLVEYHHELPILSDWLNQLPSEVPKFAITGNHEHWNGLDIPELKQFYAERGVALLENEVAEVTFKGRRFKLLGLDDEDGKGPDFSSWTPDPDAVNLVLVHRPAVFDQLNAAYPDAGLFTFSGHTHGGQITFFGRPLVLPEGSGGYVHGKFTGNSNTLYVSRGLGAGFDMRFAAARDMILLTLR